MLLLTYTFSHKLFARILVNFLDELNPFLTSVPLLYPLKTPGILWFSGVLRGYKMRKLATNELAKKSGPSKVIALKVSRKKMYICIYVVELSFYEAARCLVCYFNKNELKVIFFSS